MKLIYQLFAFAIVMMMSASVYGEESIDITISDLTSDNANVTFTPSDNEMLYYATVVDKATFEKQGGAEGVIEWHMKSWENNYYGDPWYVWFKDCYAKTGTNTIVLNEYLSSVADNAEYVAYAFCLDKDKNVVVPVTVNEFRTLSVIKSDNTFSVKLNSVIKDSDPNDYEQTVAVECTITPTNDDPYGAYCLERRFCEAYLKDPSTEKDFLAQYIVPNIKQTYTGTQAITFSRRTYDADMCIVVVGYDNGVTTSPTIFEFHSDLYQETVLGIDIKIEKIEKRDVYFTITPSDEELTYYFDVMPKEKFERYGGADSVFEKFDVEWWKFLAEIYGDGSTWTDFIETYEQTTTDNYVNIHTDQDTGEKYPLLWNTEYVLYAYGINSAGEKLTHTVYQEFKTLPRDTDENLKFDIQIDSVVVDEEQSGYQTKYYIVNATVTPSVTGASYGVLCQRASVLDQYENDETFDHYQDFEHYLQTRFDEYKYSRTGQESVSFLQIKEGEEYYLVVVGYDDLTPVTDIFKTKFTGAEYVSIESVADGETDAFGTKNGIRVTGEYDFATVMSTDGKVVSAVRGEEFISVPQGLYIIKITNKGSMVTKKVTVR